MTVLNEIVSRIRIHYKFLALLILLPTMAAIFLSLLLPKKYLSQASILPVNSRLQDKARLTGEDIAELYSGFGTGDDLDRLYATAITGNVLMKMVDSFNLVDHYSLSSKMEAAREAAFKKLKSLTDFKKTEYGELRIKVWDKDRQLSADICNAMIDRVDQINSELYQSFYAGTLQKLEKTYAHKLVIAGDSASDKKESSLLLAEELAYYRKSIADFRMAMQNPPPSLLILEKAYAPVKPDKPDLILNTLLTFLICTFTGLVFILLQPANQKQES